ncbi:putative nitrogen fixation protein NifT [Phormidium sp. FACHB-1136]|nr:putative nitrogen fixation protein NifT [Phormidium sp. FACHB-1136]MBD2427666.1 putative nitrogen fixation protein NifT [Phormidium sp. FACHB-1136]
MKVMLRTNAAGHLLVYVAKKDLEEEVVSQTQGDNAHILTLANGWKLEVKGLGDPISMPRTVDARKLN